MSSIESTFVGIRHGSFSPLPLMTSSSHTLLHSRGSRDFICLITYNIQDGGKSNLNTLLSMPKMDCRLKGGRWLYDIVENSYCLESNKQPSLRVLWVLKLSKNYEDYM